MNRMAFAQYIRRLREGRQVSQEKLAYRIGVSSKQVYRWEKGAALPALDDFIRLIDELNGFYDDAINLLKSMPTSTEDDRKKV